MVCRCCWTRHSLGGPGSTPARADGVRGSDEASCPLADGLDDGLGAHPTRDVSSPDRSDPVMAFFDGVDDPRNAALFRRKAHRAAMRCAVAILRDRAAEDGGAAATRLDTWGSTDTDEEEKVLGAEDRRNEGIGSLGPFVPLGTTAFVWEPFETEKESLPGGEPERTPAAFRALGGVKMEFVVSLMVEETPVENSGSGGVFAVADFAARRAGSDALAILRWATCRWATCRFAQTVDSWDPGSDLAALAFVSPVVKGLADVGAGVAGLPPVRSGMVGPPRDSA